MAFNGSFFRFYKAIINTRLKQVSRSFHTLLCPLKPGLRRFLSLIKGTSVVSVELLSGAGLFGIVTRGIK